MWMLKCLKFCISGNVFIIEKGNVFYLVYLFFNRVIVFNLINFESYWVFYIRVVYND